MTPAGESADESRRVDEKGGKVSVEKKSPSKALALSLVAVAAVLAVIVGWLGWSALERSGLDEVRRDAVAAAEAQAIAMFQYDPENVDSQYAAAAEGMTEQLREEYTSLMEDLIAPSAKEKGISVEVTVRGSALVSAESDRAVVLLYLNQLTSTADSPEATTSGSRVLVELEKHDDRWLADRADPI